jgi:hypothetical protein
MEIVELALLNQCALDVVFDFTKLDTLTPDFDLRILAADELKIAICSLTNNITSPI